MKYTIGVDYGTKSARAVVVSVKTGEIAGMEVKEYTHGVMDEALPDGTPLPPDWALQHPADYLEALEYTVPAAVAQAGVKPEDIIGLAVDFTACTILPVDEKRTPLCFYDRYKARPHAYAKLWKHHASQAAADSINELLKRKGELDSLRYGGKVSPELMLPKVLQMLQEDEELYEASFGIMEAMDWLTCLLTGERRRSLSGAGYKAMYLPQEGYPEGALLRELHEKLEHFPEEKLGTDICPMNERFGCLTEEWAKKLGLRAGIAVAPGIIDSHVGAAGCGVTSPGQMMMILGTSSVQIAFSEKPYAGQGIVGAVMGGMIPGVYGWESGLAAVGDLLEWVVTTCVPQPYIEEASAAGIGIHELLTAKAERFGAGETGLLALDWWSGNKTPYVNGDLSGMIVGFNMRTKPEAIYRAMIEATAYGTMAVLEAFEAAGMKVDSIVACGGIAEKNSLLMQIYADVTGRPIRLSASPQTAALGAAMYAAAAAGEEQGGYGSIQEAARHMSSVREQRIEPGEKAHAIYQDLYGEFKKLSEYFGRENLSVSQKLKAYAREVS